MTARSNGAVGPNAVVPRIVAKLYPKETRILDFGCGPKAIHVKQLREQGFTRVSGYDLIHHQDETTRGDIFPKAWAERGRSTPFELVYASNVINIQETVLDLVQTWKQIRSIARKADILLNYPESPRRLKFTTGEMATLLEHLSLVTPERSVIRFKAKSLGNRVFLFKPVTSEEVPIAKV